MSKRHRLYEALAQRQRADCYANSVLRFITHAMHPVRHTASRDVFESRRWQLNQVLAFSGLQFGEDGKLRRTGTAQTLSQAEAAASKLRKTLRDRQVHEVS